jgi:hypothetical protein
VENALLKSALGYEYEETQETRETINGKIKIKKIKTKKFERANVIAAIFWLKNRKPAEWNERPGKEFEFTDAPKIVVETLKEEDAAEGSADGEPKIKAKDDN